MLSLPRLRDLMRPLFFGEMPSQDAPVEWARRILAYSQDGQAGPVTLVSPLVLTPATGDFMSCLDGILRGAWGAAAWAGPGAVGVTLFVPPIEPMIMSNAGILINSRDPEQALNAITQSIHTYTMSITVSVTSAGVTTVLPIV